MGRRIRSATIGRGGAAGLTLRAYLAKLSVGEPVAGADHDLPRWLRLDELASVDWLAPDLALLPAVAAAVVPASD